MKKGLIAAGVIVTALALVAGGYALRYYTAPCEAGTVQTGDPGPLSPTDWKKDTPEAKYCGEKIDIAGAMRQGNFFVTAWDACKLNSREFPMSSINKTTYRPYSIQIQAFALAGINEARQYNVLVGGTAAFLWNFNYGSVGVGLTYAQGLVIPEYYAGVSVIGQIDIGRRK